MMHAHCNASVIRDYGDVKAVSSTPQYCFQKGTQVFKDKGHTSTVKELGKNLAVKNVIGMLPARSITYDMMQMSLSYIMFLKKRGWLIEARGYADCRPQQEYITKLESSSSCVKTNALFLSYRVDAFKNRVWLLLISWQPFYWPTGQRMHLIVTFALKISWLKCYTKSSRNIENSSSIQGARAAVLERSWNI